MKQVSSFKTIFAASLLFFFASCQKDASVVDSEMQSTATQARVKQKKAVTYFKFYGDSIGYNNQGLVSEMWMTQGNYGTMYQYPSSDLVIVKSFNKGDGQVQAEYAVSLNSKGLATQVSAKKYSNGELTKQYIVTYSYDIKDHLIRMNNPGGNGGEYLFDYQGEKLASITQDFGYLVTYNFAYDATKLSVALPAQFRLVYDDFYDLSGIFLNGMCGKFTPYAVKTISSSYWLKPMNFINTYSANNELLKSEPESFSAESIGYAMEFKYATLL